MTIEHKRHEWIEITAVLPSGEGLTLKFDAEWARNPLLIDLAKRINQTVEAWEQECRKAAGK